MSDEWDTNLSSVSHGYHNSKGILTYSCYQELFVCTLRNGGLCSSSTQESKYFHMSYEGGVASLAIAEVYPEDEGEYICRASNTAGSVESHCDIFVQGISMFLVLSYVYFKQPIFFS